MRTIAGSTTSWLIFALHVKSSIKQEKHLKQLNEFDESHDKYEINTVIQKHHNPTLDQILCMDKESESAIDRLTRYQMISVLEIYQIALSIFWPMQQSVVDVYRMPRLN